MTERETTSFLTGANAGFIAELYERYLDAPDSVDQSWCAFFAGMDEDSGGILAELRGPGWAKPAPRILSNGHADAAPASSASTKASAAAVPVDSGTLQRTASDSIRRSI